jgi:hypothetical protein
MTAPAAQAELAAMRLILSNVVARMALAEANDPGERRRLLNSMSDACKLAAERSPAGTAGAARGDLIDQVLKNIDEFFKGITIT